MEIVKKLMSHIEKAEGTQYRDELLSKVIEVCSHDNYKHITNFEWYVSINNIVHFSLKSFLVLIMSSSHFSGEKSFIAAKL